MHPARVYVLYNLLMGLSNSLIIGAYVPLMLAIGMSLAEITFVNAACMISMIVFEIPTGLLADGRSRRFSVSCGVALFAIATALYSFVNGFWIALAAECIAGAGNAFISGALSAWLTDALRHRGEAGRLRHALATGAITLSVAMLFGGFLSAYYIAPMHPRICWLLSAALAAIVFLVTRRVMDDSGEPLHRVSEIQALRQSISVLKKTTALKWVIAATVSVGIVAPFNIYWAPIVTKAGGPMAIAWSWVPMYGAMALSGFVIRRSAAKAGREISLIIMSLLLAGIGLVALSAQNGIVTIVMFVVVHEIGRGLFNPLTEAFTQQHVEEHYRATYGSLQSFLGKMGYVGVSAIVAISTLGKPATLPVMIAVLVMAGGALVVLALVLWIFRPKYSPL